MTASHYGHAIRSRGRPLYGRIRPKLLTPMGWFTVLAGFAVALGTAIGFVR